MATMWYAHFVAAGWGFGIVRTNDTRSARARFEQLAELASKVAGLALSPYFASTYDELTAAIEDQAIGLAWLPPVIAINLEDMRVASTLAIPSRNGAISYHAALVVRRGGPKALSELKGRRAAWVQPDSAAGYLIPRMHLAGQGLDVANFFARETFMSSHRRVIDSVSNGEADVGATYCNVDPITQRITRSSWIDEHGNTIRPIEVLALMGPIPNDSLVAASELPAAARSALTRWLLSPDDRGRELFQELMDTSEFRVPAPDHYHALRHALRAARARGHAALPAESRMRIRVGK